MGLKTFAYLVFTGQTEIADRDDAARRSAIAVGEGVAMPMRICFSPLPEDRRPKSATTSFTSAWSTDSDGTHIERTVERWRRGMRHASG